MHMGNRGKTQKQQAGFEAHLRRNPEVRYGRNSRKSAADEEFDPG